jgi:hypothetical protein
MTPSLLSEVVTLSIHSHLLVSSLSVFSLLMLFRSALDRGPSDAMDTHRNWSHSLGSFPNNSNTVGLVVEYTPATGETRVRFSDGVAQTTNRKASQLCNVLLFVAPPWS